MAPRYVIAALRLGFALLTFAAIGGQLAHTIDAGNSVVNFVSFFTIDSNILAAVLFLALGLTPKGERSHRTDVLRGARSSTWSPPVWSSRCCSRTPTCRFHCHGSTRCCTE